MKKFITSILLLIVLSGCEETSVKSVTTVKGGGNYVEIYSGNRQEIKEFEYKGHTYIYTSSSMGNISATHSGSCKCNPNAKLL